MRANKVSDWPVDIVDMSRCTGLPEIIKSCLEWAIFVSFFSWEMMIWKFSCFHISFNYNFIIWPIRLHWSFCKSFRNFCQEIQSIIVHSSDSNGNKAKKVNWTYYWGMFLDVYIFFIERHVWSIPNIWQYELSLAA